MRARRLELLVVTGIVLADQLTKSLVRRAVDLHESVPIIPDVLALTRVHNSGAAYGMLNSTEFPGKTVLLIAMASLAMIGVAWYALTVPLADRLARLGVALILAGAIGNLIDRVTAGYVLDFVDVSWRGWHFWAFNVADAAISVGVVFMLFDLVGLGRRASNSV